MDANLVGETAAIFTSCLWTFNSILFASAGKRIGSFSVNAYRIIIAVGLLATYIPFCQSALLLAVTNAQCMQAEN